MQYNPYPPWPRRKAASDFFVDFLTLSSGLQQVDHVAPNALCGDDLLDLDRGYELCRTLTKRCSKTFYFASRFLSIEQRRAVWAVYAFCRTADDLVDADRSAEERLAALKDWRTHLIAAYEGRPQHAIMLAFADAVTRFSVPKEPALDLLRGAERDVTVFRYNTYEELLEYCRLVASTVGLLTAPILGHEPGALPYGVTLGQAMQMTNILRDVGEDARMDRVYLPLEDLNRFGYSVDSLLRGVIDSAFVALMQFQIARVRELYETAMPGIALLAPQSRYTVKIALVLYRRILDEIEKNGYDVFTRRAYVRLPAKVMTAARAFF